MIVENLNTAGWVGLAFPLCIPNGGRSGSLTHIATMETVFVAQPDEKLSAFVELGNLARDQPIDYARNWPSGVRGASVLMGEPI
jgi:hypothetical protein